MSVWSDISVKVEEGSKIVADKARELSQIASIRAQIVGCDNTMSKNFKDLGRAYYETHKDDVSPEYEETMKNIAASMAKKDDLLAQLAEIKKASGADVAEATDEDFEEVSDFVVKSEVPVEAFDELDEMEGIDEEIEAAFIDEE